LKTQNLGFEPGFLKKLSKTSYITNNHRNYVKTEDKTLLILDILDILYILDILDILYILLTNDS